jgi:hypothetical protein
LAGEPVLKADATWYGPVTVNEKQTGWKGEQQKAKAGLWYKQNVEGFIVGNSANNHINLGNMAPQQYCIVAKLRAGGFYLVLGNEEAGLDFDHATTSGIGSTGIPGTAIAFAGESIHKAFILPFFSGPNTTPGDNTGSDNQSCAMAEVIFFTNEAEVTVPYTSARRLKYGDMPEIEVWFTIVEDDVEKIIKANVEIQVDVLPPNQSQFIINNGGAASGFIRLGK